MQIAANLYRIGSDMVNSYIVVDGDDATIVDAGLPGYWKLLGPELAAMGKTLDHVRALVLTHGDSDHLGFAARLCREKGITAYLHPADAERARLMTKKPRSSWGETRIGPVVQFLWYAARHGGLRIPRLEQVQPMNDGDVLDIPGRPRIIHMPGHTQGSVSVLVPGCDALFVGDALSTRNVLNGSTGPAIAPFTLDRAQAMGSLDRLKTIDATWVLPGHGPAWDGGVTQAVQSAHNQPGAAHSTGVPPVGSRRPFSAHN